MSFIVKQLRRIPRIADWLDDWNANRGLRKLRKIFEPQLVEAKKAKSHQQQEQIMGEWANQRSLILDEVYGREADRLIAKARKYGITVPPQPARYDDESEDWYLSNIVGWLPQQHLEDRLRREIRDERRASYDEFRKTFTVIFGALGFALAFYSVGMQRKQPDPCPRNYYRSDAGECVFALQKNTVAQPAPVQDSSRCQSTAGTVKPTQKTGDRKP
jgi:hypothetical protein